MNTSWSGKKKAANPTEPEMIRLGYKGHLCITIAPPICRLFPQFPALGKTEQLLLKLLRICLQGMSRWSEAQTSWSVFKGTLSVDVFQFEFFCISNWNSDGMKAIINHSGSAADGNPIMGPGISELSVCFCTWHSGESAMLFNLSLIVLGLLVNDVTLGKKSNNPEGHRVSEDRLFKL